VRAEGVIRDFHVAVVRFKCTSETGVSEKLPLQGEIVREVIHFMLESREHFLASSCGPVMEKLAELQSPCSFNGTR
jgi:hypothetical protein